MPKKRYYESERAGSRVMHRPNEYNDEMRHDKDGMEMGPYHYDRQKMLYEYKMASAQGRGDDGMIHEDHRQIANLPQNVEMKPYRMNHDYLPEDEDDTINGVDRQIGRDNSQRSAHFFPKKV